MQVFRAYFKVVRASAGTIALYMFIFLQTAILVSVLNPSGGAGSFEETRTPIAVINRDGGAPLAQGLADYLADTFRLVPFPDDPEKLQDALFWRNVEYIATIPEGFSQAFMAGEEGVAIQKAVVPDSTSSHYVDLRIDKFLNTARLHRDFGAPGVNAPDAQAHLVAAVRKDLSASTPVTVTAGAASDGTVPGYSHYYSFMSYTLLAMAMLGISSTMMAFNKAEVRLRNLCTPVSVRRMSLALAAGHGVLAVACWAVLVLFSLVFHGKALLASGRLWLYLVNSLTFAVVATAIGFAVGSFVKSGSAQAGAVNVIALGMSFLSGVFVPQSIMSQSVLAVARFLPAYWYIRAHDAIGALVGGASSGATSVASGAASNALGSIAPYLLIQLGFAAAIFSVTLLISKERQLSRV